MVGNNVMSEPKQSITIESVEELIKLVKTLKFLGVTQFKIGDIAMDLTGDSYPTVADDDVEEESDDDLLYYSAK